MYMIEDLHTFISDVQEKREVARNWRNVLMIPLFKFKVTDKD